MRPFEEEFQLLKNTLREMGGLVAQSVHRSVFALIDQNEDFAHQVLRDESRVDQMEIQIDDIATSLIVREQPMARDMRLVVVAIKINTDLERMGDLAVGVVEAVARGDRCASPDLQADRFEVGFTEIANLVESMVLASLDAFVKRDAAHACEPNVRNPRDDAVDKLQQQRHYPPDARSAGDAERSFRSIERALDHLLIARCLERIADHATNIAEDPVMSSCKLRASRRPPPGFQSAKLL